jgi:hypothetical protein
MLVHPEQNQMEGERCDMGPLGHLDMGELNCPLPPSPPPPPPLPPIFEGPQSR